jgi:hypothetical protein
MFAYEVFFSIATGFVSSLLVVVYLYRLKPNIEISPFIAEQKVGGNVTYGFKVINRTRYAVIDIKMELIVVTPTNVKGGTVKAAKAIPLLRDQFFDLGPFSKKDKEAHYALRVGCASDIRGLWTLDAQDLRFSVIAKHALSGFSSVVSHTYHTKSDIKEGKHVAGNSLQVESVT